MIIAGRVGGSPARYGGGADAASSARRAVESRTLHGVDSLLSIVQMPAELPSLRLRSAAPER